VEDLESLLAEADSRAIERVRAAGSESLAALEAHLEHSDSDVRFLVVECLAALGSAEAGRLLLRRVEDASEEVRLEAVNALLDMEPIPGLGPELARLFDRAPDGFLRRQLALVLGRLQAQESRSRLATRLAARDLARDGLVAALARLGDSSGRARLAELLRSAEGERVPKVLELFRYAARVEATPDLLPLVESEEVVLNLSTHAHTVTRRACDLAVDEFLRLRPGEFDWGVRPIQEPYVYTELVEIRALLRREAEQA
jgi:HEAT repeat protein